jgi:hypothetical protein
MIGTKLRPNEIPIWATSRPAMSPIDSLILWYVETSTREMDLNRRARPPCDSHPSTTDDDDDYHGSDFSGGRFHRSRRTMTGEFRFMVRWRKKECRSAIHLHLQNTGGRTA